MRTCIFMQSKSKSFERRSVRWLCLLSVFPVLVSSTQCLVKRGSTPGAVAKLLMWFSFESVFNKHILFLCCAFSSASLCCSCWLGFDCVDFGDRIGFIWIPFPVLFRSWGVICLCHMMGAVLGSIFIWLICDRRRIFKNSQCIQDSSLEGNSIHKIGNIC